jgi:hypothetical protein
MFVIRRKAVQSAGRLPTAVNRGGCRYSSGGHGKTGDHAHHSDHGHHGPKEESLGVS